MAEKNEQITEKKINKKEQSKVGTFSNGLKWFFGFPYEDETRFPNGKIESSSEQSLWGLWTYNKKSFDQDGYLRESREFKGNNERRRNEYYPSGALLRTGDIQNGHFVGEVKEYYEDGEKLKSVARYDNKGNLDGEQKEYNINNTLKHEEYRRNGHRVGEERTYDLDGKLERVSRFDEEGIMHGRQDIIKNGTTVLNDFETYNHGNLQGPFQQTVENSRYIGHYTENRDRILDRVDRLNIYDRIQSSEIYQDGKLTSLDFYHENGTLKMHQDIKDGHPVGQNFYHENGTLRMHQDIKDGHPVGTVTTYDENGEPFSVNHYNDKGLMDGRQVTDAKKGRFEDFQNGQQVGQFSKQILMEREEQEDGTTVERYRYQQGSTDNSGKKILTQEHEAIYTNGEKHIRATTLKDTLHKAEQPTSQQQDVPQSKKQIVNPALMKQQAER